LIYGGEDGSPNFTAIAAVPDKEGASIGTYVGAVTYPDGRQFKISGRRDGFLSELWLADVGGDEKPEFIVWMVSVGSGSYASIHVYQMVESGPSFSDASALPSEQMEGYMGHDQVTVEDGRLIRCFPMYGPDDPNSRASGGKLCLEYETAGNLWYRQVPDGAVPPDPLATLD